ncbi:MAG TPA: cytochrome P460 family protein [Burkholderiaceae bacterium]|jgi:cytochrome c553|nr:cytochrome P460 family protein [Burkholderiaceae bacterium]HQR76004.1 cytochrome P460 family protein [Burkholderiaceae bacterium]
MKAFVSLALACAAVTIAQAADIEAGKVKVQTVCAACHGANGVSVSDGIPNLAAQKARYIEAQLGAFKDGSRKNPLMSAIAAQLSKDDIANVAAYFAAQPGAVAAARSDLLPNLAQTRVTFPENYRDTFVRYHTVNNAAAGRVTVFYANKTALDAAKAGRSLPDGSVLFGEIYSVKLGADQKPVMSSDGALAADQLVAYTAMARNAGWGKDIPDMLRNGDWNYAVFTPAKQPRPGVNQAECLACHKPQDKTSFIFTLDQLTSAAKAK